MCIRDRAISVRWASATSARTAATASGSTVTGPGAATGSVAAACPGPAIGSVAVTRPGSAIGSEAARPRPVTASEAVAASRSGSCTASCSAALDTV